MTEAWLLSDDRAIRMAAGNPNGTQPLSLPRIRDLQSLPDPKQLLANLLIDAAGLNARRRDSFDTKQAAQSVSRFTADFSALRQLDAFLQFEERLRQALDQLPLAPR